MPNFLTEGERVLLRFLDQNLPAEWMIFAQPYLNGTRPDVVVFNPKVGLTIYEVKDWRLSAYSWTDSKTQKELNVSDSRGTYPVKNPVYQVDHYQEKLIGQLVPMIGETVDQKSWTYGVIKTGVYFHKETTAAAKQFFSKHVKPARPILGHDALTRQNLPLVVPDVTRTTSIYWSDKWNAEILFWLRPPFHSLEQTIRLNLSPKQRDHAEPQPGHFRLRGVAGSGKTQVLAYRAAKLASLGKRVLILTFNMTLWHYIRDMIQRAPFAFEWKAITFNHFHGFCKDTLNHHGYKWPEGKGEDLFRSVIVNAVRQAISGQDHEKWDAVLIDEGQDYYWEWYDLLREFMTAHNELLLVCDKRQNIYSRDMSWIGDETPRIDGQMEDVLFRGRWRELNTVFRLPKIIAAQANEFSRAFGLSQEVQMDGVVENAQGDFFHHFFDPHTVWKEISEANFMGEAWKAFEHLKAKKFSPSDIVILLPNHDLGMQCVQFFQAKKVGVNHVFEGQEEESYKAHKKAFWNGDGRLKMCTIHSFKGWECLNVILFIPSETKGKTEELDKVVYTAMTRTRENLIVLNAHARYRAFGGTRPHEWN